MSAAANPSSAAQGMRIRTGIPDDAKEVARLINAAFVVERIAFDGDRTNPKNVRALMNTGTFLLAEDSAGLAGCVYVEVRGDRSYLGLLSVDPQRQGTGLGRRLVAATEEHARATGCRAVDLRVISPRAELVPFYRHLGYVETGTAPFASDVQAKIPSHYILMSKPLV